MMKKAMAFIGIILILMSVSSPALAAKKDTKAPTITKTSPQDKTGGIMKETTILIRFSEPIKKGKEIKKVVLVDGKDNTVNYTYVIKKDLLVITPKSDLKYDMAYTLVLPEAAVKDAAGNNFQESYSLSFITEKNPSVKEKESTSAYQYDISIEADMQSEFTEGMQQYLIQYLKLFGINAKVKKVERIN